jgi:cytochrome c peroxidase
MSASTFSVGAVGALLALAGCAEMDKLFCPSGLCGWSEEDASRLAALGGLPDAAPDDPSNAYASNAAAQALGRKFFWDARFSGTSNGNDALSRPMPFARAPKGQPLNISCATCHDLRHGGVDPESVPGNVSIGAGWTDVNTSTVYNDAYQMLVLWNGRADSLWNQAAVVMEGTMGSTRLRVAWTIATLYRADYEALFTDYPLPMSGTTADVRPLLDTTPARAGQCLLAPDCPSTCRQVTGDDGVTTGCWPRFPLDGKPGSKTGCQPGDASEPFGDAFDCMDPADQTAVTRVQVNFGKAVAAFEQRLVSRNSAFDRFAADVRAGHGDDSTEIGADAKNGAHLFVGKAACSDCHNTPLLSDGDFYNVGVLQTGEGVPTVEDCPMGGVCDCDTPKNCLPFGAYDGIAKLRKNLYRRDSAWSDDPSDDSRQMYLQMPLDEFPKGGFRTPGLRDVELTAPYMHTGAFATLEDVVAHYNRGGDPDGVGPRAARVKPLYLSDEEMSDLVAFLKTLTGEPLPSELADKPDLPAGTP